MNNGGETMRVTLGKQAVILRGFLLPDAETLLSELSAIEAVSPFRHMTTRGGFKMSVACTNCGDLGWTSDRRGYRYESDDPHTGKPWPPMPASFRRLANAAARAAGFDGFAPDACLINRYRPGTRLSLHQDRDERDFTAPIVSFSLGLPAVFLFGGHSRTDSSGRYALLHGDVAVWGGVDRLRFHGVLPLKDQPPHPVVGEQRINVTFRKAA